MAMMDIGIPSGMTPDMETLDTSKAPMYKRSEMGYRKLSLYFDEVCVFTCYVITKCISSNSANATVIQVKYFE